MHDPVAMPGNGLLSWICQALGPEPATIAVTVAVYSVQLFGLIHEMWLTPASGVSSASTTNCVEFVTLVTVTGSVPLESEFGQGVPSTHPPPGPAGEAVGAAGRAKRMATSIG